MIETFLTSGLVVALAEIGDKTQLLALVLAARFRRPLPIILGICLATLANHAAAAALGGALAHLLEGKGFRIVVAASFFGVAPWALSSDELSRERSGEQWSKYGPFVATLIAIFLVEIGDKTQIATIALAARFHQIAAVVAGTTIGMVLANAPAVIVGDAVMRWLPQRLMRWLAALLFAAIGVLALAGVRW